jgi:hypothetical protein
MHVESPFRDFSTACSIGQCGILSTGKRVAVVTFGTFLGTGGDDSGKQYHGDKCESYKNVSHCGTPWGRAVA